MKQTILGVDIGTTNIKAVAFLPNGQQLAKSSTPTQTHYPRPDWAYYEPDEIWDSIGQSLRALMADLPADVEPAAIAFTSMGEAAVPIDAHGNPTHEIIAWFDRRTTPQAEWWAETIGEEETAGVTGLPIKTIFGGLKLLWLQENKPDAFAKTVRWLNMADYGAYRLCGATATDYSLASRMLLMDLTQRQWSAPLLDATGLSASLFGELVPGGTLLGHVHAEAAAATGLPEGLPVCSGGHDHICGSFALGMIEPGSVFDSMGTAEGLLITTRAPVLDPKMTQRGIAQGLHVLPDRAYAMGGVFFSGGCIDWARRVLLHQMPDLEDTDASFAALIDMADAVPPGSGGIFFLPHLRQSNPPINDHYARGAFVGISSDAQPDHFARAVLEGLAYEYQQCFDSMMETFELMPSQVLATGGGSRNHLLMQIKAALLGQPIAIPTVEEATCLGAAMLGGVGAGVYSSFADAHEQIRYVTRQVASDADLHAFYQERYQQVYGKLYWALREVNHTISGWVGKAEA